VDHFTKLLKNSSINTYLPTLGLLNAYLPIQYPIPSRWYMPLLLQHCSSHFFFTSLWAYSESLLNTYTFILCLLYLRSIDRGLISPNFSRAEHSEKISFPPDSWMQTSFSDPCMFHAVLFAASSHLDVIRKERDNPITHYHRRNTVRLLRDSISRSGKVPDASIVATMYLWHYEVSQSLFCRV
jgi:hypothetical protein